jgi:hypothetical protein
VSSDEVATLEPIGELGIRGIAEAVVDNDGRTVYCSLFDGFGVVDVTDPLNPTLLYEERDLSHNGQGPMRSIMDVKVSSDTLLVSGPNGFGVSFSGFFLYDVADPANPERIAFHRTRFGPHNSYIDGDYVYLTGSNVYGEPVVIFDISGGEPEEVARWKASDADGAWVNVGEPLTCHDVYVQEDTLYVAYWDAGTWLVDVSNPENPRAIAHLGGHDPAYLKELDQISMEISELPGNSHYVQPNADGSVVFVGKEAWDREETEHDGGPGGIEAWDVSDSKPALRTILKPPEPGPQQNGGWTSHNFGIDGDRLYTSWYGGGVRVYDVSDLTDPRLLGEWREPKTTEFWTAKPLEVGFIGTSHINPENSREEQRRGEGAHLYVFPEVGDDNAEPAPTMARREFPEPEKTAEGTRATTMDQETTRPTTTASVTGTSTTDGDARTTQDGETTANRDPLSLTGFDILAAAGGSGLALWRLIRRQNGEA